MKQDGKYWTEPGIELRTTAQYAVALPLSYPVPVKTYISLCKLYNILYNIKSQVAWDISNEEEEA